MLINLVKRLTGVVVVLLLLAGTMLLSSCGTSAPISINFSTTSPLPAATAGVKYSTQIRAFGVTGPPTGVYNFTLISGSFPGYNAGANGTLQFATVNTTGVNDTSVAVISGTPAHSGTYTFTVQATDSLKKPTVASAEYTLTVNP